MIPIGDASRSRTFPIATWSIVAINVYAFVRELRAPDADAFINRYALVPYNLTHGVQPVPPAALTWMTPVTSQFIHGGFLHIFFNMLFLVVFGPAIEGLAGPAGFVVFYLVCGLAGAAAQTAAMPNSHVPTVGASGAIAGVLGAYLVRFPLARVDTIVPVGCFPLFVKLPAIFVIGAWALVQFLNGFGSISSRALSVRGGGVAYFAHIGGFLAGIFLVSWFGAGRRAYRSRT